jgi:glycosyltransferase involved in cell wall biosynthesis
MRIAAAICTRDRPDPVVAAVRSVLANRPGDFELIVVDQSADSSTERALGPLRSDPRVRYVRTTTQGVSRSRNLALRIASADVVAFTDDDCTVPPEWLSCMRSLFERSPPVSVAFCNVVPGPHDRRLGFIPSYRRNGTVIVTSILGKCTARGIGAGMAVRRDAVLSLGGFDELLGPGGPLRSGEDYDLAARAILLRQKVCETDEVEVVHFGFRTWAEGRQLAARDWFGIGAAYSKPLKAGHLLFAVVPLYEVVVNALWPPLRDVLCLRRPRGLKRVTGFAAGFVAGLRTPLDTHSLRFIEPTRHVPP